MELTVKEVEILSLIALCGDYPTELIGLIKGNSMSWTYSTIKELQQKKLIKRYKKDGEASLRLTQKGGQQLLIYDPTRFTEYIKRMTRYRQSAPQRRQRIHDIAVAKVMAYNAGLMVFPDQKPAIFQQPDSGMDYEFQKACFYDSFEIKAQYDEMVKVKSTRAVGIILAKDAAYIVYSVGARIIKWTSTSERKLSSIMEGTLLNWQIQYDSWEAIMIGQDYETAYKQLTADGGYRNIYFRLDQTYLAFYFVPDNDVGELLLRLICDAKADKRIKQYLMHRFALETVNNDTIFGCDAKKGDAFVLFAYEFDMEKIKQYKAGLEQFEEKGLIICLEEQQAVLARYFDGLAEIQTIPLELIEKALV